jgi:hypothetical protein
MASDPTSVLWHCEERKGLASKAPSFSLTDVVTSFRSEDAAEWGGRGGCGAVRPVGSGRGGPA